jgi:hypothetical protein
MKKLFENFKTNLLLIPVFIALILFLRCMGS